MTEPTANELFLGRQPILDRGNKIVAYELLFRSSLQNFADVTDSAMATATVIANAFSELSVGNSLGDCRGFINVDESMLFTDVLEVLPRHAVVLEILETVKITQEVVERCKSLKEAGFTLALDDVAQLGDEYRPLFPLVEIIKVDLHAVAEAQLEPLTRRIRALGMSCLAEKVDSQEQARHCHDMGFDLFQGYFFAKPKIIKGRKLNQSQLALMRLMNLLLADADDSEIEQVLKQAPGLTLSLLRMTNSVAVGAPVKIASLRQAITVLGRRQLQRWLQLLLYANDAGKGLEVSPLLQLAATRARLMEILACRLVPDDRAFADHAFMTGILSLTPVLLGMPMAEIISQLALDPESKGALVDPELRRGKMGELLTLTENLEADPADKAYSTSAFWPGLDAATINLSLTQALAWANNIGRES